MLKTAERECKKTWSWAFPVFLWKQPTVSDRCEDTPLHWANQSEGSGVGIEFLSYCTRNSLLVDFVWVCVCVFGIIRPPRIPEAHILSSIDFQLWQSLFASCSRRSAPCRGRWWASGPLGARCWWSRSISGGSGAQQGGEERAEQKRQAQSERAGMAALFSSFAARLLAQNTLKVRRTATALILNARPPVLAQE